MGNSIAATACSDIINDKSAARKNMLSKSFLGVVPNFSRITSAILLLNPDCITAAARINAPRIKKTASLPKCEYVSRVVRTSKKGTAMMTKRLVMTRGMTLLTQSARATKKMAIALCPSTLSPAGAGKEMINQNKTASARKKRGLKLLSRRSNQIGRLSIITFTI
jgi:hypothetical protein